MFYVYDMLCMLFHGVTFSMKVAECHSYIMRFKCVCRGNSESLNVESMNKISFDTEVVSSDSVHVMQSSVGCCVIFWPE